MVREDNVILLKLQIDKLRVLCLTNRNKEIYNHRTTLLKDLIRQVMPQNVNVDLIRFNFVSCLFCFSGPILEGSHKVHISINMINEFRRGKSS